MLEEKTVEKHLRDWLAKKRYKACKGIVVDIEVERRGQIVWAIEVKGDQKGFGALRNSFFTALGQILVAKARRPKARVSLCLTEMYREFVGKFTDVLRQNKVSVIWVSSPTSISIDTLDKLPPPDHRHPDGLFVAGFAKYHVENGHLVSVRVQGKKGRILSISPTSASCFTLRLERLPLLACCSEIALGSVIASWLVVRTDDGGRDETFPNKEGGNP